MRGETDKTEGGVVPAPKEESRKRLRVLVVDDNLDQVRMLSYLVKDDGHHVDYAINGIVALDMAQRFKPDVMLLDIGLPDATGYEVVRQIRRNPELKATYVIGVTGMPVEKQEALAKGFDDLLQKPVMFREVEAALSRSPKSS